MSPYRRLLVVVGATWLACAACEGGGSGTDAGTESGGPIVIQLTGHVAAESLGACGGCHVVIDEVRAGEPPALVVPDLRLHVEHAEMMIALDFDPR